MKKSRVFFAAAALALTSAQAWADPMPQGTFTVGAERLMGIFHGSFENDPFPGANPSVDDEMGVTTVTLFGNGLAASTGGIDGVDSRSMFMIPRVGFDYFIIDGLSLGGSLTLWTGSAHFPRDARDDGSATNFLFAPRVGYAYMFSDVFGIWPRGGLSYTHGSVNPDQGGDFSNHYFAFEVDVPLVIAPVKNVGFTVGPLFDITLGGSQTAQLPPPEHTRDASLVLFGLSAGMVAIF